MIEVGDRVQLKTIPPGVEAMSEALNDEFHTKEVFQQCVGHVFLVRGVGTNVNSANEETDQVELWVHDGDDWDNIVEADIIWVEPEYLEVVTYGRQRTGSGSGAY